MTIYNNDSPDNIDAMINNKNQKSKYEDDNLDSLLKEFDIEDADIDVDIDFDIALCWLLVIRSKYICLGCSAVL